MAISKAVLMKALEGVDDGLALYLVRHDQTGENLLVLIDGDTEDLEDDPDWDVIRIDGVRDWSK